MLFLYEIKKLYKNRIFLLILSLFILLDFICIFITCKPYFDETYKMETSVTDNYEGAVTKEKVDEITENYNRLAQLVDNNAYNTEYNKNTFTGYEYMDYNIFSKLNDELYRIYNFSNNTKEKIEHINASADFLSENENNALSKKYRKTADSIAQREITEFHNFTGVNEYISYDISTVLVMLLGILVSVLSFSKDKELVDTVYTCSYSKAKICRAKILSIIINSTTMTILFRLIDLLIFKAFVGLRGIASPLFYLEEFETTYFEGSILSFSIFKAFGVILSVLLASMLASCVAIIIGRSEFALFVSAFAVLIRCFKADDFIYPQYFGALPLGYARIIISIFVIVAMIFGAEILHRRRLKYVKV